jgi:secondary thiamine-phosphate synthase enzyme
VVREASISVRTGSVRELVDVTDPVRRVVREAGVHTGICHVFVAGATAAIVVHEGDDPQLRDDLLELLDRVVPEGKWRHDRIDDNGAAHLRSAWLSPSETLPVRDGDLALGTWQRLFLCEFDGPRPGREIRVTVLGE